MINSKNRVYLTKTEKERKKAGRVLSYDVNRKRVGLPWQRKDGILTYSSSHRNSTPTRMALSRPSSSRRRWNSRRTTPRELLF